LSNYPHIFFEVLMKIIKKNFSYGSRIFGRDSNQEPPEYNTEMSLPEATCSVEVRALRVKIIKPVSKFYIIRQINGVVIQKHDSHKICCPFSVCSFIIIIIIYFMF
jgi:hypothetical protein